jgi:hypothetical protein
MTTPETPLRVVEKSDALAEAATPPPAASAPRGRQPISIQLTVPIDAHGDRITSVTLQPLTVQDIVDLPIDVFGATKKVDPAAINYYIMKLGNIPRSSVLQLDPGDWLELMGAVVGFFSKQVPRP